MENKGLNIFNTAYVLAVPETATDSDYEGIEGVIGHEYFHNWTGNRVTCRDWFQLTLKEGLTVFRDQQFSSDMGSAAVKRIEDVRALRGRQFAEDAGPRAHNIRPESYMKMDNFYTATVYEKGAQVIRMYHTLLGEEGFRKGMDLYFERHDGSAVTCDDFRAAMADASGKDLTQFERWYLQAGTPTVTVVDKSYDSNKGVYKITLQQTCEPSVGQPTKLPFHIPVAIGLLNRENGKEILPTTILELTEAKQTYELQLPTPSEEEPVASVLRDFSAPVRLKMERSEDELSFLMKYDTDSFNRWEASQTLATVGINYIIQNNGLENGGFENPEDPKAQELGANLLEAYRAVLMNALEEEEEQVDKSLLAYALTLPDTSTLLTEMVPMRPLLLNNARSYLRKYIATNLKDLFQQVFDKCTVEDPTAPYVVNPQEIGRRRLRNICLGYLSLFKDDEAITLAKKAFDSATCMTDSLAALGCLANMNEINPEHRTIKAQALKKFHDDAKGDPLVLNKWFTIQATADYQVDPSVEDCKNVVQSIQHLMDTHPKFSLKNPNVVRALVSAFANANIAHFHTDDGSGYRLVGQVVQEVDKLNGLVAARLAGVFSSWRKMENSRSLLMKAELEKIIALEGLSKDTYEIVSLSLYAK